MKTRGLLFRAAEGWLRVENILFTFWSMFWTLNGLDKFFNGVPKEGDWGPYAKGWFGTNRDEKFVHYFDRLDLPKEAAICSLYGFAVLEIILGIAFFTLLFQRTPKIIHRTCFKASLILFIAFMTGDILFGDRKELWEHGTFMILVIITFQLYLDRAMIRKEVLQDLGIDVRGPVSGPLMGIPSSGGLPHGRASVTREFNMLLDEATTSAAKAPSDTPEQKKTILIERKTPPEDKS